MIIQTAEDARNADASDPLAPLRDTFHLPQGIIYLDGNSLGPMPKNVPQIVNSAVREEWAEGLIRSWNAAGWWELPTQLGEKIAPLIGAAPGQTVVSDSTSINLYKAVHAALAMRPDRSVLVTEAGGFPTDLYITEGVMQGHKHLTRRLVGEGGATLDNCLDEDVAVLLLSHVDYRTGELLDMAAITAQAHKVGAIVIWDLCHSAGALPVSLDAADVDLAVGCTYKYLNGGPGSQSFVYAAIRLHGSIRQPLTGWWSHAAPFEFEQGYRPDAGIKAFMCGTQSVLSLRAMEAALDIFDGIDMAAVRQKSLALTDLFIKLVETECAGHGFGLVTPRDRNRRGGQVSFTHEHGYAIMQALIARGVIGDFRMPNILRFGFPPLYISFQDVWSAVAILKDIMESGAWQATEFSVKTAVT